VNDEELDVCADEFDRVDDTNLEEELQEELNNSKFFEK